MRIILIALLFMPGAALAADPPALLAGAEQDYYEQIFDYVMTAVEADKSYGWESYSGKGEITAGKSFVSKSKATCRNFRETFTIADRQGSAHGVGCKREGRDGWCRLKTTNALTCAMESPDNPVQERMRDVQDTLSKGDGFWATVKGWFR